ncbi:MAG TPA: hypothetical protein VL091_08880 [Marinobacter sp.]|nr:hypothetical protein [Marinobacter sp.]
MADTRTTTPPDADSAQRPVLRPGRAADPVPVEAQTAALGADLPTADDTSADPGQEKSQPAANKQPGENDDIEQTLADSRQRKLRLMLRQCDRVLLMDFDLLAMNGWPDNFTLATARRSRDLWMFSALVAAVVFLSGLSGFVPAWIAGTGFGAFVIILLLGIPVVRQIYTSKPSYLDLVIRRQRMLRDARKHVAHLEGKDGLIWQCARMEEFNAALRSSRFSHLISLSESTVLPRYLVRREHVRLYLIYLLEAEKAYSRVQQAFFDGNQNAIDHGWREVVAEPEPRA